MGKYFILRDTDKTWYVKQGWSIVFRAATKEECTLWCKENP